MKTSNPRVGRTASFMTWAGLALLAAAGLASLGLLAQQPAAAAKAAPQAAARPTPATALGRTRLPIAEPQIPHSTVFDVRNATAPPHFQVKAPAGAPNVLIVLIDDMGFGQSGAFGGPVQMPTAERLAQGGLRYHQFHTTALCSPTRSALLSGRNHHMNNTGSIMETATAVVEDDGLPAPYRFTGKIAKVTIDVKDMKPGEKGAESRAIAETGFKRAVSM